MEKKSAKNKKPVEGLADEVLYTGAGLMRQKMQYDYEKTLTKEEREKRYEDRKKTTKAVFVGLALAATAFVTYSFVKRQ